jgi:acyl carrier protein
MTTSGKVRRAACRELLQQGQIESLGRHDIESRGEMSEETVPRRTAKAPPSAKEIERWLVQRIAGCLRVAPAEIDTDKPFLEMGMGSLDAIEVTSDLQQWLGRNLSPTAIYNYPNIASLATFLAKSVDGDAVDRDGPSSAGGITPAIATDGGDFDPAKTLLEVQGLSEAELAEFLQAQMADLTEPPSGK